MSLAVPKPPSKLFEEKRRLRTAVLSARDQLCAETREEASKRITGRLLGLPSFRRAHVLFMTLAFGSEVSTHALAGHVLSSGKLLVVPKVNQQERMLDLYAISDLITDVSPGVWGISEPLPERAQRVGIAEVDWALVPGVAFDRTGGRIGYGGGYYDRLLPALRKGVARIAAAYSLQLVQSVPAGPHDARVDAIVTENEIVIAADSA